MTPQKFGYMNDVDRLIEQASVSQVLAHYGKPLPEKDSGEYRMECVFSEDCADSQYGNLTVKLNDVINRIYCHTCKVRGNLLTLLHGLETHQPPTGGRLRGEEFKAAVAKLREIAGQSADDASPGSSVPAKTDSFDAKPQVRSKPVPPAVPPSPSPPKLTNPSLHRHEKEAARALANLHEELITDVSQSKRMAKFMLRLFVGWWLFHWRKSDESRLFG